MKKNKFNGTLLRKRRMELGMSQLELANEVNSRYGASIVDATTISRWEINPNAAPRNNKLVKVATVLGCNTEELFEEKEILQEVALTMEEWIDKLTKDNKEVYISEISDGKVDDDTLTLLMKSWRTFMPRDDLKEYEEREYAYSIYKKLDWKQNNYDVINSFWTTFACALVSYAKSEKAPTFSRIYSEIEDEKLKNAIKNWSCPLFGFGQQTLLQCAMCGKLIDIGKKRYAEKVIDKGNLQEIIINKYFLGNSNVSDKIVELAGLCHCVANFMPCPDVYGGKYNSIKGCLPDVRDYFPLMVDKIQQCVSENRGLKYLVDGKEQEISYGVIKNWHEFFLKNRRDLLLDEFYYITKKGNEYVLVGIPLFRGQSLSYPFPKTKDEVEECIGNIISITQNRALKIADKLIDKTFLE